MFGISLSVTACLRGGTHVDVAWVLDPDRVPDFDVNDAVGITPGGGRLGSILGGAIDSRLTELSLAGSVEPRIVTCALDELEAGALGVEPGTVLRLAYVPAERLPERVWEPLLERRPVAITADLDGDRLANLRIADAPTDASMTVDDTVLTAAWAPTPTLALFGGGPIVDALGRAAGFVGWNVNRLGGTEHAIGVAAMLSPLDGIVVLGHDTESVGRVLQAALGSRVGYIGSIGPVGLQEDRGDWLAYRGVTDTSRIHGPAGLDIGATTPEEVALAVICEMVSVRSASTS